MDVKTKLDFEKYYQSEYKNTILGYYEKLKEKRTAAIVLRIISGVIVSIMAFLLIDLLNLKTIIDAHYSKLLVFYNIFIAVGVFLSIKAALSKMMYELNEDIIRDIIAYISENTTNDIMFEPKKMLSRDALEKMELFNLDVVKYTGKNYIKALYNKNSMVFSDMETYIIDTIEIKKDIYKNGKKYIRTIRRKKKRTIFKGIYMGATLNKKNSNHIYLIPNNLNDTVLQSKIMSYIKYHGTVVNLENLDFSRKYKVFCDDEVQARYILSLSLMERINKIDEMFSGKKYIVFKEGKRFAICVEGLSIENIKNEKLPAFRNEKIEVKKLENMFLKLNGLFNIYHVLDLGNDLYTKYIDKPIK